jgi:hypothetical protein
MLWLRDRHGRSIVTVRWPTGTASRSPPTTSPPTTQAHGRGRRRPTGSAPRGAQWRRSGSPARRGSTRPATRGAGRGESIRPRRSRRPRSHAAAPSSATSASTLAFASPGVAPGHGRLSQQAPQRRRLLRVGTNLPAAQPTSPVPACLYRDLDPEIRRQSRPRVKGPARRFPPPVSGARGKVVSRAKAKSVSTGLAVEFGSFLSFGLPARRGARAPLPACRRGLLPGARPHHPSDLSNALHRRSRAGPRRVSGIADGGSLPPEGRLMRMRDAKPQPVGRAIIALGVIPWTHSYARQRASLVSCRCSTCHPLVAR